MRNGLKNSRTSGSSGKTNVSTLFIRSGRLKAEIDELSEPDLLKFWIEIHKGYNQDSYLVKQYDILVERRIQNILELINLKDIFCKNHAQMLRTIKKSATKIFIRLDEENDEIFNALMEMNNLKELKIFKHPDLID